MKKTLMGLMAVALVVVLTVVTVGSVMAAKGGSGGITNPPGVPLYVIIEVEWDGDAAHASSWTVWGPKWEWEIRSRPVPAVVIPIRAWICRTTASPSMARRSTSTGVWSPPSGRHHKQTMWC